MTRKPFNPAELAAGLRALANDLEAGDRPTPRPGEGLPRTTGGAPVVPLAVHDALCGWRIASRQENTDPDVLACAGCGMAYLAAEAAR